MTTQLHPGASWRIRLAVLAALFCINANAARPSDDLSGLDLSSLMEMDITLTTAQKRTEDADLVPISMTVLKTNTIKGVKLDSSVNLHEVVPGIVTHGGFVNMFPFIRGIGTDQATSGVEASVAMYVDGIYQPERIDLLQDLADAEQIEVLRGPQGTLYGRNATGGAINITTRGPTDKLAADATVTLGSMNLKDANLFIGGPAGDDLRLSLAAHGRKRDGYYTNIVNGAKLNNQNFHSLHGRAQWDLSSTLRAELLLKYRRINENAGFGSQATTNSIPGLLGIPVGTLPQQTASELDSNPADSESTVVALKLTWDASAVTVQSNSAVTRHKLVYGGDIDASAAPLLQLVSNDKGHSFMQEFLFSPARTHERIDWLLGAFYMQGESESDPITATFTFPGVGVMSASNTGSIATRAFAGFGESTLTMSDAFSLTAGLRYSAEEKTIDNMSVAVGGAPASYFPERSHTWDNVTYRLVAKYVRNKTMLYAKTETGFRSGNYNNSNVVAPGPVDPERVTAYEVGAKKTLIGTRLHLGTALFYNDYRDLQIMMFDSVTNTTSIAQAPKAETYGLDANADFKASERWTVGIGFSWLHAQYREFIANGVWVPSPFGGNVTVTGLDLAGKHLTRAPAFTGNLLTSYRQPLGSGDLVGTANYYHSGRIYFDPANQTSQDAYSVINASLAYQSHHHWQVSAWAKNLANEQYFVGKTPSQTGTLGVWAEPRIYGISVGYSFAE